MQPGKTDAGALFTSNVSSNAFGPRGTVTVLSKITIVAAVVFMISALMISLPAFNGGSSVLNSTSAETQAPADANTNTNANSAANPAESLKTDNNNGALIQMPATNAADLQPSNSPASNANASAPVNTKAANTNAAAPKKAEKPTPKK